MFDLKRIFNKSDKEQIAQIVAMDKDAFDKFEKAYRESAIDGAFGPSAKDVVSAHRVYAADDLETYSLQQEEILKLCDQIVDELICSYKMLPAPNGLVSKESILKLPANVRPQLTSRLMKVDIDALPSEAVLSSLRMCMNETDPRKAMELYGMFRQGLDILDLDPICYEMLGKNQNSIGNWFPALKAAAEKQSFFKIPETKIIKVPLPILQLTRIDFSELTLSTKYIVNQFCMKAFDLDVSKKYFIKTGVFSSKFDFRNAKVEEGKEVGEIGEYLLYISHIASQMASPLNGVSMYGAATTNEWVVREFIEDSDDNPCIYHGMPLRTEYRVFIDCDTDEVIGMSPYWRPDVMKKRFGDEEDRNTPDMVHDYIVYTAHEPVLMKRYEDNKDKVLEEIKKLLPNLNLKGQWSLDVMQNGNDFYLIDMATADTSALNDVVPKGKLKSDPMPIQCFLEGYREEKEKGET